MIELDISTARAYVETLTRITPERITELAGGVSNTVLLVEHAAGRFVLKQSLPQLRVEQDWFSDRKRIFREAAALRRLSGRMPPGSVPQILFEDPENFVFAMSAAPPDAVTWKSQLLSGCCDERIAGQVAQIMAAFFTAGWRSPKAAAEFGDLTSFEELRLSPYYETTASRHPDLAGHFAKLIARCRNTAACLVHGDFSPKNVLVAGSGPILIDWECVHFGDPAFDSAFLLNHLLLKSFNAPDLVARFEALALAFWSTLRRHMPDADWFEEATIAHWGGLLLARVDGKSPVEYIRDPSRKDMIRLFARSLMLDPPHSVAAVFQRRAGWC